MALDRGALGRRLARYTGAVRHTVVTEGIVIRRTTLPSGDVVATLLSEHGKWRAVARKGRVVGGNLARLSLFHDVTVQYYRKHDDDLALLTQVRLNGALPNLARPEIYPYAHVLAELTDALTVDVHLGEKVYAYLASGLRGLNRHSDPDLVALAYAWKLLGLAGLAPFTTACLHCQSEGPLVALDVAAGGLTCRDCARGLPLGEGGAAELQLLVGGELRQALRHPPADRALHWRVLAQYLGYHVRELHALTDGARPPVAAVPG